MYLTLFLQAVAGTGLAKALAALAASIAVIGASFGISRIGCSAVESIAMFAVVVCFLVLFV